MPNSKAKLVKAKHRKRKERMKAARVEEIGNAKKRTMRAMNSSNSLPKIYQDRV